MKDIMKLRSTTELREENIDALNEELKKAEKELFTVKMNLVENSSKQTHLMKGLRRYIARIKTLLNEKVS